MKVPSFLETNSAKLDKNGIWNARFDLSEDERISKEAWDSIYDYQLQELLADKKDFNENKLADHMRYIEKSFRFTKNTVYLEIGSGPAFIGEYLMRKYHCHFIGVDFNYQILLTLKKYFDQQKLTNYTLIHGDINKMPIKADSVDYIYGGGVIEHFADTRHILVESHKILKKGGVSFNTVPAFNLWWLTRFYNNIPSLPILKQLFSFIHIKLLGGNILQKYYGYELSFIPPQLRKLHQDIGFQDVQVGAFAFNPSDKVLKHPLLRRLYFMISSSSISCPVYYVSGKK